MQTDIQLIDLPDTPELPIPQKSDGMLELVRLWHTKTENEVNDFALHFRPAFKNLTEWSGPIALLIQSITKMYANGLGLTDAQINTLSIQVLAQACEQLGVADILGALNAQITSEQVGSVEGHPGEIGLPDIILQDPKAKQVLSIWHVPDVHDCHDCGEDHEPQTYISGSTDVLSPKQLGENLAKVVVYHAQAVKGGQGEMFKAMFEAQKAFNDGLSGGLPRA